jgi:hypothetical protein
MAAAQEKFVLFSPMEIMALEKDIKLIFVNQVSGYSVM